MNEGNTDNSDQSWRNRDNSTETSNSSRGFRGRRWNDRSRGNRGTFNSQWISRNGRGRFGYNNIQHQHQQENGNKENYKNRNFNEEVANYGIAYQKIEDLCNDMDLKKILPGSAELLTAVQIESFYKRLNDLWPDVKKQSNFLRIIVATASTYQKNLLNLTWNFITKVLESKLLETIVENCICPLMYDSSMQENNVYSEIAHYIVKLMLIGFSSLPTKMDPHLPKVLNVITSLKEVKDICLKEATKKELERLEIALKDRHERKAAQRLKTETRQKQVKDFEGSIGEPSVNFRELSIVPIPEDIIHQIPPYLRAAKTKGKYDSDEQYLDIQFRLLREDLIRPLRDGITAYRKGGTKETDLYVYSDVELGSSTMHKATGELISYASIKVSKRMRWDKRLKYGSLVCLSSDDFQQVFLFATVLDREELPQGKVGLKFEEVSKINTKWKYKMVESPAFFEAYRHVMMALQSIEQDEPIPFSNYLVNVETNVLPPTYSIDEQFNFKLLFKEERENSEFNLHEIQRFKPEDFGMDESQFNAFVYALTSELAIIQGPPGTGKTYMGLQIAKLLFDNWNIWNPDKKDARPMLVVCYTNHALDQFLEGISKFVSEEDIIRVGGRCRNANIEQFNLAKKRRWDNSTIRNEFINKRDDFFSIQRQLEDKSTTLKALETRFASPNSLNTAIYDVEKMYFNTSQHLSKNCDLKGSIMFKWLTQTDQNYPINPYDIIIIRQLIAWNIPEIKAKNILADAYQRGFYPDAINLLNYLRSPQGQFYSATRLSAIARYWPKIADIDNVKRLGFADTVAAELLVKNNINLIREEYNRNKEIKTNRQFATVTIPEPMEMNEEIEEIDEIAFKDDDEDNRMIVDSNVLDEFQVQKKKTKTNYKENWFNNEILQDYREHITSALPMTDEEANQIGDIWALSLQQRWRLYQYWIQKCRKEVKEKIKDLEAEYGENVKLLDGLRSLADLDVLKGAKVVGMTTTGAAKHQSTLRGLKPKIVVVEEAAEVLEAHILTSLTQACQHLILIGDHKQLRPNPAVFELAKKYNLEISLFERLINNGYPYRMLKNQHRMCTDISQVLMPHFYENLLDDPSVLDKEAVKGVTKNLFFINHSYPEVTEKEFKSHRNDFEAKFALQLAQYFLQQTYKAEQITILCTYLDQLLDLRKMANEKFGKEHGLVIQSVDNYQGEENDIVILSLVRSNNPDNKIGFLKIPNRVCVALSRAKLGLYVICNMDFLAKNCEMWNEIRQSATKFGAISNELVVSCQMHQSEQIIKNYKDFDTKCREGGCDVPCSGRLECGHQCVKPCHVEDMDHIIQKCLKPCERKCNSEFQHPCKLDCWKPCGDCCVKVLKALPCFHEKVDYCYLEPSKVRCVEDCQKTLSCGHQCKETCGADCTQFCKEIVERLIPECGHTVVMQCSQKMNSVKCNSKVIKKWPLCNHTVETECSSNVTALPCPHPCNMVLSDCNHRCKGTCGKCRNGRLHIACSENCNKIFLCEHECESKCSKICPPCSKPCETACGHSQCGTLPIKGEQPKKTRILFEQNKQGSKTGRCCGEPCPPCMEDCLNRCEHRQCSKKCGDPCDVKPCLEPCMKLLPCDPKMHLQENNGELDGNSFEGYVRDCFKAWDLDPWYTQHLCIGICGEDCPKICKICNPEQFTEIQQIFFGTEDAENARFIQLKDCGHILEVNGLDQWIEFSLPQTGEEEISTEIVQIKCPQCKTSIRRSKRYISILNERAIDIEQIKQKTRGLTKKEKDKEKAAFGEEVKKVFEEFKATDFGSTKEVTALEAKFVEAKSNVLTKDWFLTSRNILRIIQTLSNYEKTAKENINAFDENLVRYERLGLWKKQEGLQVFDIKNMPNFKAKLSKLEISNFWCYLNKECSNLIKVINPFAISETMIQQISFELQRFGFIIDLLSYFSKSIKRNVDFNPDEIEKISGIFECMNGSNEFKNDFEKEMSEKLENLAQLHPVTNFGLSKKERIEIISAVGSDITHWYKCPNGHLYGIGDCGGAVMTTTCPECKEEIGGGSHRLLLTNQDAQAEMFEDTGINGSPYRNPFEAQW